MGTEQDSLDPNSDEAIFAAMSATGTGSEKEAADLAVARMLKEEAEAGRGEEPDVVAARKAAAEAGKDPADDAQKAADQQRAQQEQETENQRKKRLKRERIERVYREREQYRSEAEQLRARLREVGGKAPDPEAYGNNTADYVADRAAHSAQQMIAAQELEKAEARAKQAAAAAQKEAEQSEADYFAEGKRKYADFETAIRSDALDITPAMKECLLADDMIDIAYHLAKNPLEMNAIAALSHPLEQVKAIIKAQAALEAKAAKATTSQAPAPIKPVKGSGAQSAQKRPEDMSYSEYRKWRESQSAR